MNSENLDKSITESVIEIVVESNQPKELATKILSWLDAIHSGRESLEDRNGSLTRIDVLLASTKTDNYGN